MLIILFNRKLKFSPRIVNGTIGKLVNVHNRAMEEPEPTQEQKERKRPMEEFVLAKHQCKNLVIHKVVHVS